jgi:hypothetical protein
MPRPTKPEVDKAQPVMYSAHNRYHLFLKKIARKELGNVNLTSYLGNWGRAFSSYIPLSSAVRTEKYP